MCFLAGSTPNMRIKMNCSIALNLLHIGQDKEEEKQYYNSNFSKHTFIIHIMKSTPVICGIDLGSWSFKISYFSGQKFDVLTNQANFRQTPCLVGFTPSQRLIGEPALIKLKTNFSNTIRAPQRMLGLQRNPHLLQEELRYEKLKYSCGTDLKFTVQAKGGICEVTVEEILISLFSKINSIIETHGLSLAIAYLGIPTYIGQQQREGLKKCAELAFNRPIRLVDDWVALSAQYTYNRLKQLKTLEEMKHIVFMDIGYSKVSLHLVQFTRHEARLLDWQHLPYTGCKNMDHNMSQFYSEHFFNAHKKSIIQNPKAYIKLLDAVQIQRMKLSANNQYHINLEYLLNDEDLSYNIKRDQFQNITVSVLADIASAMASLQARSCTIPIHAIQLMGGASRIPCIQGMASKIFGLEPSRGLNQSEAIATGCSIFGAIERKIININYRYDAISTRVIGVKWGKERQQIISANSKIGSENHVNVGNEGLVQMSVFVQFGVVEKIIGKLRFKTPNKVTFVLDENKIIQVKLALHQLQFIGWNRKTQEQWKLIYAREQQMCKMDMRMGLIYQLKNDYQSKLYGCKSKIRQLISFATKDEIDQAQKHIKIAQMWVQQQHSKNVSGSIQDLQKYQQKNKQISYLRGICQIFESRKKNAEQSQHLFGRLSKQISLSLQKKLVNFQVIQSDKARQKILQIMSWAQQAYQAMQNNNWASNQLNEANLEQAILNIRNASL